jgi:hypothetical protein
LAELPAFAAQPTPPAARIDIRKVVLTSLGSITDPAADYAANDSIKVDVLVKAGAYTRRKPFFVDLEQATEATRATVELHFGILRQQHAAVRIADIHGATVTGQGAVVTAGNLLVKESVVEFTAQGRAPDGLSKLEDNGFAMSGRFDRRITEPCILAKRPWYRNFGHWLVDGATVVALAAERIREQNLTVIIGDFGSPKMRAVVNDTIQKLVPGANVLSHRDEEIWHFDDLCYVTPPHVPPLFKLPEALQGIRSAFLGPDGGPAPFRKIFVTRRTAGNRRLVNEAEIFELCAARGFEFVDPEQLSIGQQAVLFAQSSAVIGAKGAALTSVLFCHPDTKVMLMSPADFPDPFFWDVAQNGCDYAEVFGPIVTDKARGLNEFTVEPARVSAMLDAAGL